MENLNSCINEIPNGFFEDEVFLVKKVFKDSAVSDVFVSRFENLAKFYCLLKNSEKSDFKFYYVKLPYTFG